MLRRKFIGGMALLGAGSVASMAALETRHSEDMKQSAPVPAPAATGINYAIEGFTCIACAVGLEVLLRQQKGVCGARAVYATATAHIDFDPALTTNASLRSFIEDAGFHVSKIIN